MKKIEDQIPDSKLEFTVEPSVYIDIDDQGMSMDKRCDMIKILFFQLILIEKYQKKETITVSSQKFTQGIEPPALTKISAPPVSVQNPLLWTPLVSHQLHTDHFPFYMVNSRPS